MLTAYAEMDPRSEYYLGAQHDRPAVHPDLCRVLRHALQLPVGWRVVQGVRTLEEERAALASGHSHTLHSRHLPGKSGFGCAVDVAHFASQQVDWAPGHERAVFSQIAIQIIASADHQKVPIQWGGAEVGAWTPGVANHFFDWGHFQLPWREYP